MKKILSDPLVRRFFSAAFFASAFVWVAVEFFDVEVDGKSFDEMHVDGSTITQIAFIYGAIQGLKEYAQKEGISVQAANTLINKHSGMLGISGISQDMREIEESAAQGNQRSIWRI